MKRRSNKKTDRVVKAVRATQIIAAGLTAVAVTLTLVISFNEADQMDKAQQAEESFRRAAENATGAYHDDTTGTIRSDIISNADNAVTTLSVVDTDDDLVLGVTGWPYMTPEEFKEAGVIQTENWVYTWYSELVLPGEGLKIPGRHVDEYGFVRDCDGYLCVACNTVPQGYPIDTPFGVGKVYDLVGEDGDGVIDIYVSW